MSGKKLVLLLTAAVFAATLWGCGSNRDSGDSAIVPEGSGGTGGGEIVDAQVLGIDNCAQCHDTVNVEWLKSGHANTNLKPGSGVPHTADSKCFGCHNPLDDGSLMPAAYGEAARDVVGCESCHGGGSAHRGIGPLPTPSPGVEGVCANCHSNPGSHPGDIVSTVMASNHGKLGHNDRAKCQRCHTTEGAIQFAGVTGDKDVMGKLDDATAINPEETTAPACLACHDPHTGGMRIPAGWEPLALDGESETSNQFKLCTSCHVYTDEDGTLVASGVEGTDTKPFYHNTAWYRTIASTHYDDPTTGPQEADYTGALAQNTLIEGYVLRTNSENPCFDCHSHDLTANTRPGRDETILTQWAKSGHAGGLLKTKYDKHDDLNVENTWGEKDHRGNTAKVNKTAEGTKQVMEVGASDATSNGGFTHYNWDDTDSRGNCQRCHTATGAANHLDDPANYVVDGSENDFSHLADWNAVGGSTQQELLYCWSCHSDVEDGDLRNPGAMALSNYYGVPVTYNESQVVLPDVGSSNVCLSCHGGMGNMNSKRSTRFVGHHAPAGGILFAKQVHMGFEYPNQNYTYDYFDQNGHITIEDACVTCHLGDSADHTFAIVRENADKELEIPNVEFCASCHTPGKPYEITVAKLEEEKAGYVDAGELLGKLVNANPEYLAYLADVKTINDNTTLSKDEKDNAKQAALDALDAGVYWAFQNQKIPTEDRGGFAHNRYYVKRLLFDSIDYLDGDTVGSDGNKLDGQITIDATIYEDAAHWFGADANGVASRP